MYSHPVVMCHIYSLSFIHECLVNFIPPLGLVWLNNRKGEFKMSNSFNKTEITRLQKYMQEKFSNAKLTLSERKEAKDSVEVNLGGEFIGVVYKDSDEGEVSYDFNMAILELDLPAA